MHSRRDSTPLFSRESLTLIHTSRAGQAGEGHCQQTFAGGPQGKGTAQGAAVNAALNHAFTFDSL